MRTLQKSVLGLFAVVIFVGTCLVFGFPGIAKANCFYPWETFTIYKYCNYQIGPTYCFYDVGSCTEHCDGGYTCEGQTSGQFIYVQETIMTQCDPICE